MAWMNGIQWQKEENGMQKKNDSEHYFRFMVKYTIK